MESIQNHNPIEHVGGSDQIFHSTPLWNRYYKKTKGAIRDSRYYRKLRKKNLLK